MSTTFLISDTHFGHLGVTKFLREDGTKLRPWDSVEEMDEAMIENWNKVVTHNDKVYHLGDVVINRKALHTLYRLNGTKVLIKGNHDLFRLDEYTPHFKDIRAYHVLDQFLLAHIPVHPESLERWSAQIHGHLHANTLKNKRYINVSVEQIDYTPIPFDLVKERFRNEGSMR
jgi:calcineurin-like phosphoesterase family protein